MKNQGISVVYLIIVTMVTLWGGAWTQAEEPNDTSLLTLDRIFDSNDFKIESVGGLKWLEDGSGYTHLVDVNDVNDAKEIVYTYAATGQTETWVDVNELYPTDQNKPLLVEGYQWSKDRRKVLIYTNSKQVWRAKTRGDYWVLDRDSQSLQKIGGDADASQLMFAKFSPDAGEVAYVHQNNIYVQTLKDMRIRSLTKDGSENVINGTADWVNEEELRIRDGFRWSPDGRFIAYWQFDTTDVESMTLVNNTAERYPQIKVIKYPKAGKTNSICRVGVVSSAGGKTKWLNIPGDPREHYIPSIEWREDRSELVIQQVNRLQNTHCIYFCEINKRPFGRVAASEPRLVFTDQDEAWFNPDVRPTWLENSFDFLWLSERDGWKHLYRVNSDTGVALRLSLGNYDITDLVQVNEDAGLVYVMASPDNATQRYLYRIPLDGGQLERVTPVSQPGTHRYQVAKKGPWALHHYSAAERVPRTSMIRLTDHESLRVLETNEKLQAQFDALATTPIEFFQLTIHEDVSLDGWCIKPPDFDPQKQYPVLFHVYGEPAGQTVKDSWPRKSGLWHRLLAQQGMVVISLDNRGTPAPKGREWRKCIYRQVGILASEDQALAVRKLLEEKSYLDPQRVAVWGWSGGGSMTLNALFRYPDLYQVGIAVAFVSDMHYYDTIYQERYMGLPQDNTEGYKNGSPITFAHQLQGDLLLIYGTGDDNCHYQNCEALLNKLIEHNKPYDLMIYPNRRHGISKGKNTTLHLYTGMTRYLQEKFGLN